MESEPSPCRPQDLGKFEVTQRDGAARLGKFFTKHGVLNTPALLPVVNPNILTVEPRSFGMNSDSGFDNQFLCHLEERDSTRKGH